MKSLVNQTFKAFTLLLFTLSTANATLITGADLLTNANVSLPGASTSLNGSALQFSGGTTYSTLFTLNLSNYGFGLGAEESTSGSIELVNTRITSDSDIWFGLWDGTNLETFTSWDGNRSSEYTNGSYTTGAASFVLGTGGTTLTYGATQAIGSQLNLMLSFDLMAKSMDHTISSLGFSRSSTLTPAFNTSGSLYFLVGKGSDGEVVQIDSLTVNGGSIVTDPIDASAPPAVLILGAGLLLLLVRKRQTA
ncbi:hypothetical protein [Alteromonas antoniana]|uniref:hypothetical protein n=1 Tax=Alteromonas antoniana TaxID=2803813 RepID=UPI001C48F404|nr:hypothetical protein [Alteromonas antoniana]